MAHPAAMASEEAHQINIIEPVFDPLIAQPAAPEGASFRGGNCDMVQVWVDKLRQPVPRDCPQTERSGNRERHIRNRSNAKRRQADGVRP